MVISHNMVVRLTNKGIVTVSDLADFDWESIKQTAEILRRSGGSIPNPNPGAAPRTKIPTPPFNKSQTHLVVATNLVRFYNIIDHALTASSVQWNHVTLYFQGPVVRKQLQANKCSPVEIFSTTAPKTNNDSRIGISSTGVQRKKNVLIGEN